MQIDTREYTRVYESFGYTRVYGRYAKFAADTREFAIDTREFADGYARVYGKYAVCLRVVRLSTQEFATDVQEFTVVLRRVSVSGLCSL